MDADRYHIVLTGEIEEGHELDNVVVSLANLFHQPAEKLRLVVGGHQPFPLKQEFELDKATRVRERILAAGAKCRLEPASPAPEAVPAGHLSCPKCGHRQPQSDICAACGIVFAKYHARAGQQAEAESASHPMSAQALEFAFIGPKADTYEAVFARFRRAGGYAFSWHWPAFFMPVLWALYRKLWMWAAVMFLSSILWPLSSLVWAATANYIYFRHVRGELDAFQARPGSKDAEALLAEGGVSRVAAGVAVGLSLAVTLALAVMVGGMVSLVDSMSSGEGVTSDDPAVLAAPAGQQTVVRMNAIAVSIGLLRMGGTDVEGMDMAALQQQLDFPDENVADSWGTPMRLDVGADSFIIVSAGPDAEFGTVDDITAARPLP